MWRYRNKRVREVAMGAVVFVVTVLHFLYMASYALDFLGPTMSPAAYVFYATANAYACSAVINIHRLRHRFNTRHRIVVLVSEDVSPEYLDLFAGLNATVLHQTPPQLPDGGSYYYKDCLLKLVAFKMHLLDPTVQRLLVLDSDQLIVRNIDFMLDRRLTDDVAAPSAYWLAPGTLASTCMLIQPNPTLWEEVEGAINTTSAQHYDMDIFNDLFAHRARRLSGSYVTLNSHWEDRTVPTWFTTDRNVTFPADAWARDASDDELDELYNNQTDILHYTAVGKPWMWSTEQTKLKRPDAHPVLFHQWSQWRILASELCPNGFISVI
ncbi:hypothetical protein DCS_04632 [Drechmeria coniospora]|uniref:Uncharacterized protein n=1 Tax=Drechmeria coniospora TaxID=98403 RepID=A0A151GKJ4_DRECN|nr:hypothetical protein DCS_04632 [Drechmeria coniospora]KYK57620.1 hypothetical protein DCS_04632 [Drechmeria coniospora]